jgi:hypothetical protein
MNDTIPKSGFHGVGYYRRTNKWRAIIKHKGKTEHLGYFDDPKEAARAYDAKARELGRPEHKLNFPQAII